MTARLLDFPCPICAEEPKPCQLCLGDPETAHALALEVEGLRIALEFAEFGHARAMLLEPWRTLPLGCDVTDLELPR